MFRKLEHTALVTAVGVAFVAIKLVQASDKNLKYWHGVYTTRIIELATQKDKLERHIEMYVAPVEYERSKREALQWLADATE